jgi:hypothetical protein
VRWDWHQCYRFCFACFHSLTFSHSLSHTLTHTLTHTLSLTHSFSDTHSLSIHYLAKNGLTSFKLCVQGLKRRKSRKDWKDVAKPVSNSKKTKSRKERKTNGQKEEWKKERLILIDEHRHEEVNCELKNADKRKRPIFKPLTPNNRDLYF